ncbi:MAG: hypothetical protein AAGN35_26040 [Bacteroidota bacterium]
MKLPIIKHLTKFVEEKDEEYLRKTVETLEAIAEAPRLKDAELDVIGELLSNLYGAIEVQKEIQSGKSRTEALNGFMKRVMSSIDQ